MTERLAPIQEDDLMCMICSLVYKKPTLCECGHTFCEACINRHCDRIEESCPLCRYHVKPLTPNIIVQMAVDEWNNETPARISPMLDLSNLPTPQSMRFDRGGTRRSLQNYYRVTVDNANFSVPRERAPRLSFRQRREHEVLIHSNTSGSDDNEANFQRSTSRRRSERSRRPSQAQDYQQSPSRPFSRLSSLRETVAGLRVLPKLSVPSTSSDNDHPLILELSSQLHLKCDKQSKSKLKALWKRVPFMKFKKPTLPIVPARSMTLDVTTLPIRSWGRYRGAGANFTRLNRGIEILVGVFGNKSCGKTTFVNNFVCCAGGSPSHVLLSNTERMDWSEPLATNNPPLAILTSTAYMEEDGFRVVDLVEAECDSRFVNGVLTQATSSAFVNSVDAAILLYSMADESSFTKIMGLYRRLAQRNIPCIVVGNNHLGLERRVHDRMVHNIFGSKRVTRCETNLFDPNNDTVEIVQHIVKRVAPPELPPFVVGSLRRWENGHPV